MSSSSLRFAIQFLLPLSLLISNPVQALQVVTSIKPVQLLVAAISDGVTAPQLLIPGASSPHDFQLRPSERRELEQAQLIFWIGPQLEMSLTKVLQQLPPSTQVVSLMASLPNSKESVHSDEYHDDEPHQDEQHEDERHHEGHNHGAHDKSHNDPHIWLDPGNAEILAHRIETALSEIDPTNQARYQQNLQGFISDLKAADLQLEQQLSAVRQQGYFVFHDGYQGFEQHYRLNHLGAFTLSPERRPGARHLAEIRQQLEHQRAVCVFSEPQFSPALIDNLIDGTHARKGQLDPMATNVAVDAQGYVNLLRQLGQSFTECLSQPAAK
ncbi:MAG: zinc ABC transporter substrate-binding protein ZnuA [Motiliproteus sp.]